MSKLNANHSIHGVMLLIILCCTLIIPAILSVFLSDKNPFGVFSARFTAKSFNLYSNIEPRDLLATIPYKEPKFGDIVVYRVGKKRHFVNYAFPPGGEVRLLGGQIVLGDNRVISPGLRFSSLRFARGYDNSKHSVFFISKSNPESVLIGNFVKDGLLSGPVIVIFKDIQRWIVASIGAFLIFYVLVVPGYAILRVFNGVMFFVFLNQAYIRHVSETNLQVISWGDFVDASASALAAIAAKVFYYPIWLGEVLNQSAIISAVLAAIGLAAVFQRAAIIRNEKDPGG